MKLKVKQDVKRTSLFLRGIEIKTKKKLSALKKKGKYRTYADLLDAILE